MEGPDRHSRLYDMLKGKEDAVRDEAEASDQGNGHSEAGAPPEPGPPAVSTAPPEAAIYSRTIDEPEEAESTKKKKKKRRKERRSDGEQIGSLRGVETLFRTAYATHMDLSAIADNKANIMITINGIMVSLLLASISPKIDANHWLLLPTSIVLVGCLVSLICAVLAALPRINTDEVSIKDVRRRRGNILFFGSFSSMTEEDYVQGMTELVQDTPRLYQSMMRDIHALGTVLARKFRLLRIAYFTFVSGLVLGVFLFIGVYVGVVTSMQRAAAQTTTQPQVALPPPLGQ
ncbi:MAG TPA: Pycsar system effector family protein [Rhodothermales bacterium]|nr:Pycsar system effector family protein [Rhodothermales bacterium]